jgi:hypothetical protein
MRKVTPAVKRIENNGITGDGMGIKKYPCSYNAAPITQRAKSKL